VKQVSRSLHQAETRARIIDVAAHLLQDAGPEAVTTRGVAHEAGVQAPAIYRLFGDKDGLLEAVAEHVMSMMVSEKAAVAEEAEADNVDPVDDLGASWQMQIDFGLSNPALFQLLSEPARVQSSAAARSGRRVLESQIHRVAVAGRLRVSEERAVLIIQAAAIGAIQATLGTPIDRRDPGFAEAMYEAALNQILTDAPEFPADGTLATTIAFRAIAPQIDALTSAERHILLEWLDRVIAAS
jgi:AcrR family transcriptional regulator